MELVLRPSHYGCQETRHSALRIPLMASCGWKWPKFMHDHTTLIEEIRIVSQRVLFACSLKIEGHSLVVPHGSANPKTRYVFPCSSLPKCSDQLRGRFLDVVWDYFWFSSKEKGICRASGNIEPGMNKQHMYCPKIQPNFNQYLCLFVRYKSASSKTSGIFNFLSGSHHEYWLTLPILQMPILKNP